MKTLFVSSEIYPFAKSGGLADVASSLAKALSAHADVTSVMPLFGAINQEKYHIKTTGFTYHFSVCGVTYHFEVYQSGQTLFLKEFSGLFEREEMYGDYEDNDIRFGIFCYGVLEYIKASGHEFDIIHLNDWQSALIALLAKEYYHLKSKIVFTIHNLAYQGIFPKESLNRLALSWEHFTVSKLEYHDKINLLKSAIAYSDVITTVSPTYATEIQTKTFGCNLENLMQDNAYKLRGILNGIDYEEFHPTIDPYLPSHYNSDDLSNKKALKAATLQELGLEGANKPLFVFIGRFTAQKGIDQILSCMHALSLLPINIAILGSGEEYYNYLFSNVKGKYPNISVTLGYNETLARKLYAAGDFLYMPSQYEPCGLNQMIAMTYGGVPIVRQVGGLKDSVADFDAHEGFSYLKGAGITFSHEDEHALMYATHKAIALYSDKNRFDDVVHHNMSVDFSWEAKSKEYLSLYTELSNGWLPERKIKEFEIPTHYNIDTLTCIAVNPHTLYTYWEITQKFLHAHRVSHESLLLRAYVNDVQTDQSRVYDLVGNYYFYPRMDFQTVQTKIGYMGGNGDFIVLLASNRFIAPNAKVIKTNQIIWRNLTTQKLSAKRAYFWDETLYERSEPLSSAAILKRNALQEQAYRTAHISSSTMSFKGEH